MNNINAKTLINMFIVCTLFGTVVLFIVLMINLGFVTLGVKSFAVDSLGRMYIGKSSKIEVYEKNQLVNSFSAQTSRSFVFTILENDEILLSTGTIAYLMDIDGNVIDSWGDTTAKVYNNIQFKKNEFISSNGDVYRIKSKLGWTKIVKNNGEVVYKITLFSFIVKIVFVITVVMFVWFILFILKQKMK